MRQYLVCFIYRGYLNNEMVGNRYNPAFGEWVDSL